MVETGNEKRVLLLYYSFSGQTAALLGRLAGGLKSEGLHVEIERLRPAVPLRFPVGSVPAALRMMLATAFRQRVPIAPLSERCRGPFALVILAGPTWSFNPSGPVLSFLDRDHELLHGKSVLPLISCRGYWRLHWWGLRRMLRRCGARPSALLVFPHPHPEPWRTLGVFLKIAGKSPETMPLVGGYYRQYGHDRDQLAEARRLGSLIGKAVQDGIPLADLDLRSSVAVCRQF